VISAAIAVKQSNSGYDTIQIVNSTILQTCIGFQKLKRLLERYRSISRIGFGLRSIF